MTNLIKLFQNGLYFVYSRKNHQFAVLLNADLIKFLLILVQEATEKDEQEHTEEADQNVKPYLADAYLHPIFHSFEEVDCEELKVDAVRVDKHHAHVSSPSARIEESSASPPAQPAAQYYSYGHDFHSYNYYHHHEVQSSHYEHHYQG